MKIQTHGMGDLENIKTSNTYVFAAINKSCKNSPRRILSKRAMLKGKDSHAICVPTQCDSVGVPGKCNMVGALALEMDFVTSMIQHDPIPELSGYSLSL